MRVATETAVTPDVDIVVHPLQPTIGAEIQGIDLREPLERLPPGPIEADLAPI